MSDTNDERRDERLGDCDGDGDGEEKKDKSENIENRLLKRRIVLVDGPVNDRMYRSVASRMLFLEQEDPDAAMLVVINSPGGSADSGFGLYDLMRFVKCPVKTLCAGMCASAAVLIFLGADKGKRMSLPNSRFLLHQPSTTAWGQASDMEITAREILRTRQRYAEIVAEAADTDADKVMGDSNRDFWLDANEAKSYGIVDRIVAKRDEA